ncbi:MAG: TraB/GumN family protein [Leptolyngbyaceae cyanobacterium MAG.088]|nr:TraB/GumN family protein [Leptolyngbyaceae cyanobacterium MAG.088]
MPFNRLVTKACLPALFSLASVLSLAQPSSAQDQAFLWEIESPNNTVYLLGSIHLLRETDYPIAPSIQAAFDEAENVVFEVEVANPESPQTLQAFLTAAAPDSPDELLYNALDDDTYRLAQDTAIELGIPFNGFNSFEPWALYLNLTISKLLQLGFEPSYGVDAYFFNQATLAQKDTLTLETIEEQLGFLDNMPVAVQADLVKQTILELETLETVVGSMVAAWHSGDVPTFESLTLEGFEDFPEVYDALLVQRNQNWMPEIESFINQPEDYLVIVGAAHLVGEDSVVQLLQNKGYSIEQVGHN